MSLQNSAISLLDQLKDTIETLKPNDFSSPVEVLSNSTVGQHMRHTIEFFICLMDAATNDIISYDQRKHDAILEIDSKLAIHVIGSIQEFLSKEISDRPLTNEANYEVEGGENVRMTSSFHRELAYCIEHAIHHMALIKVAIHQKFNYVSLPPHFGVASSTVRYQQGKDS
ncbi:MAG: DinB family protein [Cytophagales bacterium]|nr:DinB family protein [Cytophagales bacterium]